MKDSEQTNLTSTSLTISFGNPPGELDAFSTGICHLTGHVLTCPEEPGSGLAGRQSLGRKVGLVNGHPAYWISRGMRISAHCHSIGNGPRESCKYTYDGFLKWQYVRGGWADVTYPTARNALKIARNARFGPAVAPPARFALQLTGLPSGSYVDNLETTAGDQGGSEQYEVRTGRHDSPVITVSKGSNSKLACQYGVAAHHTDLVINGYQVEISHSTGKHEEPWQLCAPDADGLNVVIFQANNPTISNADLFAGHMRLLGPDQANWTTKPIG
jgi:hypothetical protein